VYTHHVFEAYERRFARAMADIPDRAPWVDESRAQIIDTVRRCLGIQPEWVPEIRAQVIRASSCEGVCIEHLRFTSWDGVHGAALR